MKIARILLLVVCGMAISLGEIGKPVPVVEFWGRLPNGGSIWKSRPQYIEMGTMRALVEHYCGKPLFVDHEGTSWYKLTEEEVKYRNESGVMFLSISFEKNRVSAVELFSGKKVKLKPMSKH